MTEKTMLFKNARIIDPSRGMDFAGELLVSQGKIQALGEALPDGAQRADEVVDCAGMVLAPGLVDMHVHLRDPGQTRKEDVFSACRAAAAGGVTSLLAMPNTVPPMDDPALLRDLLERAKSADAHVYSAACVTRGLRGQELTDFSALRQAGAIALSDDGVPVGSGACLLQALRRAPGLGMIVSAHCEDKSISGQGILNEGEVSRRLGVPGIANASEDCGVAREIAAAASIGAPVHVCHVSTAGSVALIRDAKARGVRVTAETCPHYLLLTEDKLLSRDADYRMNPPLRREEDRLAVLEGVLDGTIDCIVTDHAPHTPEEKADFLAAPNGVIGMETSLSAVLTALGERMSLAEILYKMSTAPANILGIPAGTLQEGAPADLVLFEPDESWVVEPERLHGKSRNAVFKGMRLRGRVKMTLCAGRKVFG